MTPVSVIEEAYDSKVGYFSTMTKMSVYSMIIEASTYFPPEEYAEGYKFYQNDKVFTFAYEGEEKEDLKDGDETNKFTNLEVQDKATKA